MPNTSPHAYRRDVLERLRSWQTVPLWVGNGRGMPGKPEPTPPPTLVDKNDVSLVARNMISARMRFQQLSPSGFCANSVAPLLQCLSIELFTLSVIWSCSPSLFASPKRQSSSSEKSQQSAKDKTREKLRKNISNYLWICSLAGLLYIY